MNSIFFCHGTIDTVLREWLDKQDYSNIFVLCDENTAKYCLPKVSFLKDLQGFFFQIPAGEAYKNLKTAQAVWSAMTAQRLDRKALCINLGGGVVSDLGGFCAATYKRGIDFVQIPTTLLSQADASIGGKVGIDFEGYKNQIGVFAEPKAIFIDTNFLDTLPAKEVLSGFVEIIKHCLIADKEMWDELSTKSWHKQNWNELIEHSVNLKKLIVTKDPYEKGIRKLLNFGHTVGHALESFFLQKDEKLLHGEAVAWGIIAETFISYQKGFIQREDLLEIQDYIVFQMGKNPILLSDREIEEVILLTLQDKKSLHNQLRCTLLSEIGRGMIDIPVSPEEVQQALYYINDVRI